jgi:hypothetical protein
MVLTREDRRTGRRPFLSAAMATTYPSRTGLGLSLGLHVLLRQYSLGKVRKHSRVLACDAWCGHWLRLRGEPKTVYTGQESAGCGS